MTPRPFVQSIEVAGVEGLGGRVRLELERGITTVVGRNGAGKSLLLAAISELAEEATFFLRPDAAIGETSFRCEVDVEGRTLTYEYTRQAVSSEDEPLPSGRRPPPDVIWSERCFYADPVQEVWRVERGVVEIPDATPRAIQAGTGLLSVAFRDREDRAHDPPEARLVLGLLGSVVLVPAGVPRQELHRYPVILTSTLLPDGRRWWRASAPRNGRVAHLAQRLATAREGFLEEFEAIARRLGLAQSIKVDRYAKGQATLFAEVDRNDFATVSFDGTNVGLLSDGTLRVAEIVEALMRPPGAMLLIEEPETAVHPGLLQRVLAELEAYATDRQIVISTHAPSVVTSYRPESLRLVTRGGGSTQTRRLSAQESQRVEAYLHDEGTLGEFVFDQE